MTENQPSHRAAPSAPAASRVGMVWAQAANGTIGRDGTMPWSLPEDMAHFKRTTMGHPVVMGRHTWESIPPRFRPLAGRTTIVLTSHADTADEVRAAGGTVVADLDAALAAAAAAEGSEEVWIVGGGKVYAAAAGIADTAVVTRLREDFDGDTLAPELGPGWTRTLSEPEEGWTESASGLGYRIELWEKRA